MSSSAICASALKLPIADRAALIDELFDSIDGEINARSEREWAAESERRIDAVDRGELKTVDGPGALRKLRQSIQK